MKGPDLSFPYDVVHVWHKRVCLASLFWDTPVSRLLNNEYRSSDHGRIPTSGLESRRLIRCLAHYKFKSVTFARLYSREPRPRFPAAVYLLRHARPKQLWWSRTVMYS